MPRPGPRPYDCVRRAWHSDRHHPIRGSLIQQIFKLVNQVHSLSTRKNREWQEKLPVVVLKAEEIIYSKANSEPEYSDLTTLWERLNHAINTIIRTDHDTTQTTGDLLHPCIEAALHLGCTPRRSSRSQRNDCPTYYLRPQTPPPPAQTNGNTTPFLLHFPHYSTPNACLLLSHDALLHPPSSSNTWSIYPLCDPNPCSLLKLSHQKNHSTIKHDSEHSSNRGHGFECDLTLRLGS